MLRNLRDNGVDLKKVFLIFLAAIFLIVIAVDSLNNRKINDVLIIKESLILTKKYNKWVQVENVDDNLLSKKYTVEGDFGKISDVKLNYNKDYDLWYYMDQSYKDLSLDSVDLAYTKKFKDIKVADYKGEYYSNSDDDILKSVLEIDNVNEIKNNVYKISFDFDNDGVIETIYKVDDYGFDTTTESSLSSVFITRDGSLVGKLDEDDVPYLIYSIVDLNNDGKYEVIIAKDVMDTPVFDSCYQIYSINGNTIKKIMGCK